MTELAADTGLSPGGIRAALWTLLRRGLVTNDRFDVIRRGEEPTLDGADTDQRPLARGRSRVRYAVGPVSARRGGGQS